MYFELLIHKNRFIRKFASQSISFVLRNLKFSEDLVELLFKRLNSEEETRILSLNSIKL